jgi:(2Fe-2S) ferredoxin
MVIGGSMAAKARKIGNYIRNILFSLRACNYCSILVVHKEGGYMSKATTVLYLRVDPELFEWIEKQADAKGISLNLYATAILTDYKQKHKQQ